LYQSFDRINSVAKLNNASFEQLEKRVVLYTKRRHEREHYTPEFQRKEERAKAIQE
jgi:hypothetical protein